MGYCERMTETEIMVKKIISQDGIQDYFIAVQKREIRKPFLRRLIEKHLDGKR